MNGHEEFVNALVAQLPNLRRYAVALVGNAALADDLVQDSMERALKQSAQLRELKHLPGWLRRILYNRYIDGIRRDRSRGKQQDISEFADHLDLSISADDRAEALDFLKAVNTLSEEHRQILLLVGLEDLSYQEISEELGIPLGTVMSRLARARERLRGRMEHGARANVVSYVAAKKEKP
jgi:RNA polymerase sigma-70 factor (ECF subfamily)